MAEAASTPTPREIHEREHCDCRWAHPTCWHCDFTPPACNLMIHTGLLVPNAIYSDGKILFVLFCIGCEFYTSRRYNLVPKRNWNWNDAYDALSLNFQLVHELYSPPTHVPGTPIAVNLEAYRQINNPEDEDEFVGFEYEEEPIQENALETGVSPITEEEEGDIGSDPAE